MSQRYIALTLAAFCLAAGCNTPSEPTKLNAGPYSAPTYQSFDDYPVYTGNDLGFTFNEAGPHFRVWAPTADVVELRIYSLGNPEGDAEPQRVEELEPSDHGTWKLQLDSSFLKKFYTVRARIDGNFSREVPDPYAKAVGINGQRGYIVDPSTVYPDGSEHVPGNTTLAASTVQSGNWANHERLPGIAPTDVILWEMHVRDLTSHSSSGSAAAGLFGGVSEPGTRIPETQNPVTGLDHLKELGITHVHLLPSFD